MGLNRSVMMNKRFRILHYSCSKWRRALVYLCLKKYKEINNETKIRQIIPRWCGPRARTIKEIRQAWRMPLFLYSLELWHAALRKFLAPSLNVINSYFLMNVFLLRVVLHQHLCESTKSLSFAMCYCGTNI